MSMTKADFEMLASTFAEVESQLVDSNIHARLAHRGTVYAVAIELAKRYPRFNRAKFELWSLPIFHRETAKRIADKVS